MTKQLSGPHIRTLRLLTLLIILLFQTSCNPFNSGMSDTAGYNDIVLNFRTDHSWARVGESVHMQFTVANHGNKPVVIEAQDRPVMDIIVEDVNSRKLFLLWSAQNPTQASQRLAWQPGESRTIELSWTAPQEEFGRGVFLTGMLSEGTKVVQSVGGAFYVGYSGP